MAIEIVTLVQMVMFHSYVEVYQRVPGTNPDPASLDQHGHPLSCAVELIGCQHSVSGILASQLATGRTGQPPGKVENVKNSLISS